MLGLMSSLADRVGMSIGQVQFLLVCFLSICSMRLAPFSSQPDR